MHKTKKKPFTIDSPLPPDIVINAKVRTGWTGIRMDGRTDRQRIAAKHSN